MSGSSPIRRKVLNPPRLTLMALVAALRPHLRGSFRLLLGMVTASIVSAIGEAFLLISLVRFATAVASGNSQTAVAIPLFGTAHLDAAALLTAQFAILVLLIALATATAVAGAQLVARGVHQARTSLTHSFLLARWPAQSMERPGRLQELAAGHTQRLVAAVTALHTAATAGVNFVILFAAAVMLSPTLAMGLAGGGLVLVLGMRPMVKLRKRAAREQAEKNSLFSLETSEIGASARDVHVLGVWEQSAAILDNRSRAAAAAIGRTRLLAKLTPSIYQYGAMLLVLASLAAIHASARGNPVDLGGIIVLLIRSMSYSQTFNTATQSAAECLPYLGEIREAISDFRAAGVTRDGRPITDHRNSLDLRNVSFVYDADPRGGGFELRNISILIAPGETLGIIGPSGGGKSTLVHLLLRLYEPSEGQLLLAGQDAATYSLDAWARVFGFVPQENKLIRETIAENIRYRRPWIGDDDIRDAARRAHIDNDIARLPQGFDTRVGPGLMNLSGGQRQRLGLARALAGHPEFLILDEPTSALDMMSESLVQQTLAELHGEVTLVIVAHRMSTISHCDRVLVLDRGQVQGLGTPQHLQIENAFFAEAQRLSGSPQSRAATL